MIYVYPKYKGDKKRHFFLSEWSEVNIVIFAKWQKLAKQIKEYDLQVEIKDSTVKRKIDLVNKIHLDIFNNRDDKKLKQLNNKLRRFEKQLENQVKERKKIINKRHILEVEGISLFTDIPASVLIQMKMDIYEEVDDEMVDVELNDNHIQLYKNRLRLLSACPLPKDKGNEFFFQGETDEVIKELEDKYDNLGLRKLFREGKELKRKIEKAKNTKYTIKNIWEQTTTINKTYQEIANSFQEEMNKGNYDNLGYLLSILCVEGNEDSEILSNITNANGVLEYTEKYNEEFKKILMKRLSVFTEQKKKIPVTIAIKARNFFLSN